MIKAAIGVLIRSAGFTVEQAGEAMLAINRVGQTSEDLSADLKTLRQWMVDDTERLASFARNMDPARRSKWPI